MKSGRPASSVRSAQAQNRFRAKPTAHDSAAQRVETAPASPATPSDAVAAAPPAPNTARPPGPLPHPPSPAVTAGPSAPGARPLANPTTPAAVADTSVNIAELKRKSMQELHELAESYGIDGTALP